jgi:hypothetical protein
MRALLVILALALACDDEPSFGALNSDRHDDDLAPPDVCGSQPNKSTMRSIAVYFGTTQPTYVPLTAGQIQAIGTFGECSGTFITEEWVLTAVHCSVGEGDMFCVGTQASNPNICFDVVEAQQHPQGDIALARVDAPLSSRLSSAQPIAILQENMDTSWIGETAEAAGYGSQEDGGYGEREFTAEPIVDVSGDSISIEGSGERGVCFGDSGGPLMVIASDGNVRVAGDLSYGDPSCTGTDTYTRVDVYRDWLTSFIGDEPVDPEEPIECNGEATTYGACDGDTLVWCAGESVIRRPCATCGETCGLVDPQRGYACLEASCADLPPGGRCNGGVLDTCASGTRTTTDCVDEGRICDLDEDGASACLLPSECGALDYQGRCDGDVAVWCDESGVRDTKDCAASGQSCGWAGDELGYYCL